jgi:hypothetical protein
LRLLADVLRRAPVEFVPLFGKERVERGKIGDDPVSEDAEVAHGHAVPRRRPAVGIGEGRIRHPEGFGAGRHQPGKARLGAVRRQRLAQHAGGIVAREHHDPAQQVLDPNAVGRVQEHRRAAVFETVLRDRQHVVHAKTAVGNGLEGHVERHQLGHGGRRQRPVGVLLKQHRVGRLVEDIGGLGARVEALGQRRLRHGQHHRGGQQERGRDRADHGGVRPWAFGRISW